MQASAYAPPEDLRRHLESLERELTERNSAEAALRARHADLLHSNQELTECAYVVSHDLQEPLRTIASFAQLLAYPKAGRSHGNL